MQMDKGMDSGDILAQRAILIDADETAGMLHNRLGVLGAELLRETVGDIAAGRAVRTPQNHDIATYAPKLSKKDGEIDWGMSAREIHNRVRGFNPWPCCFCHIPDRKHSVLRVLKSQVEDGTGAPGAVLDVKGEGPVIACGDGALRLLDVQPQGKRVMTGREYICGHALQVGEVLRDDQ
jgi:methionyl-tRNA formyltransferase